MEIKKESVEVKERQREKRESEKKDKRREERRIVVYSNRNRKKS